MYNSVMPILLYSDDNTLQDLLPRPEESKFVALLTTDAGSLRTRLEASFDELLVVDVTGPSLKRLNFDAIEAAILDLSPAMLLSQAGRRLLDALGRLAAQDELTLVFAGEATGVVGGFLENGVTAGLNLIPGTVIVPAVQEVDDLRALLAQLSEAGLRLLALDAPAGALYHNDDSVEMEGAGSLLMVGFSSAQEGQSVARLQPLSAGMRRHWPNA